MAMPATAGEIDAGYTMRRDGDAAVLVLAGRWQLRDPLRPAAEIEQRLARESGIGRFGFDTAKLEGWDSTLLALVLKLDILCRSRDIAFDSTALPPGLQRLMALATAVPERQGAARKTDSPSLPTRLGLWLLNMRERWRAPLSFIGCIALAFAALLRGKARYRRRDFVTAVQDCGAQALPIVSIITLLVGLILAFIGAVQLRQFGASIYVADLVGIAMTREMAAIMTGIVLAGRTGAAFAAQIGTMQGNEEVDALTTLGISPIEFLVLPRLLALALMMPLLYIYGCFVGLFGGYLVGVGMLDLTSAGYIEQSRNAITFTGFSIGLVKSIIFGAVVAFAGCLRGMQAGRSAAAVGDAATSAVVTGIVMIIVLDALFAVLLNMMGI